jgi:hypothetical protein
MVPVAKALCGFSIDRSHEVTRANEPRPFGIGGAGATVAEGVWADHEPGCDRRQQPREFGDVPSRAVFKALADPLVNPPLSASERGRVARVV